MTLYELLLFVHVLAAAAWFGAALLALALVEIAERKGDLAGVVWLGEYDDALAKSLFIPAAVLTLAAGIGLVLEGPWRFLEDGWVLGGLVLLVGIFALGLGLIVPVGNRLRERGAAGGPAAELALLVRRYRNLSRVDVALLAAALFLMTAKPF